MTLPSKTVLYSLSFYLLLAAVFFWSFKKAALQSRSDRFLVTERADSDPKEPFFREGFISSQRRTAMVHSAAIAEMPDRRVRSVWYGGEREGSLDTGLYTAVFSPEIGRWSPVTELIDRRTIRRQLARQVRRLGNPVLLNDRKGRIWLFFVTTSIGGWGTSSINWARSGDNGETWSPSRRLIAHPFFNISTLAKGPPFLFGDGTIGLPVYHESLGNFCELLRIDPDGKVLDKDRLTRGSRTSQPVIVPRSTRRAVSLMRTADDRIRKVWTQYTRDGGRHWSPAVPTDLDNPDSALSALRYSKEEVLLVFNNSAVERLNLCLGLLNPESMKLNLLYYLEGGRGATAPPDPKHFQSRKPGGKRKAVRSKLEFSYPYLIQAGDGSFHLVYTWHRRHIKHIQFNRRWVEGLRIAAAGQR